MHNVYLMRIVIKNVDESSCVVIKVIKYKQW